MIETFGKESSEQFCLAVKIEFSTSNVKNDFSNYHLTYSENKIWNINNLKKRAHKYASIDLIDEKNIDHFRR